MRKLVVKAVYVLQAIRKVNQLHLGDTVIHKDYGEGMTIQGVRNPYWDVLFDIRVNGIHKSELRLKNPFIGRIKRIKGYYTFKMQAWFRIDTWQKPLFASISRAY